MAVSKQWTRVRTLGRGASGAEVFLAADDASGELFAVKSAAGAACAAALRREQRLMSGLRSPRVVSCIGGRGARDGSYQLFLEFAPGGSLADRVASNAGLEERAVRGYAADVAAGLAYLHGTGMVHGDVKARNVVIGADGRAKLADFGCAREASTSGPIIGGTPAFMAPEVARGEEQGPAADVWALGCMVVEMATGHAPWSGMDGDALAALHRIGYTEAVPEVPQWLSAEAKDFLRGCLVRQASDRCTAAQLLEHPFLASAVIVDAKPQAVESKSKWVSPKSTLDAAFWESESDTDDAEHESTAERRMRALACPASALPDWDSDEGWIDVLSSPEAAPVAAEETADLDDAITPCEEEASSAESGVLDAVLVECSSFVNAGEACDDSVQQSCSTRHQSLEDLVSHHGLSCTTAKLLFCNKNTNAIDFVPAHQNLLLAPSKKKNLLLALLVFFTHHRSSYPVITTRWTSISKIGENPA
ncbi:hypothetical protein CFC21_013471 [Triticum aestivum]|uniref:Protein kinase domain-containing protein n=2 Tax=Triticum aestivum TaxID=4565 RepID=A0A3B6A1G9_WHEAT|nr:mitogen-activated protein kinase kinase kinase 17-like [Triticum aestivum]KAF6997226.1 hypothetical protein CFC21_013471 [Triticum aestivum]